MRYAFGDTHQSITILTPSDLLGRECPPNHHLSRTARIHVTRFRIWHRSFLHACDALQYLRHLERELQQSTIGTDDHWAGGGDLRDKTYGSAEEVKGKVVLRM